MFLPLTRGTSKVVANKQIPWKASKPFVENSRGTLIHRPKEGMTYNLHDKPHIGIGFYCGMHTASSGRNLTFLDEPPADKVLCARCEENAVKAGRPSADTLAGRHVHVGGVKAVITCCEMEAIANVKEKQNAAK